MDPSTTANPAGGGKHTDAWPAVNGPNYGLREVVTLTGLSKQALYAWERRYGIVEPRRDDQGSRAYSESEVHRLQLLKRCVAHGHRIGKLASLGPGELKRLARTFDAAAELPLENLLSAVEGLDVAYLEHWLPVHFSALGPSRFARDLVLPLMSAVGACVESGNASIAGERLLSSTLRTFLGQALRLSGRTTSGPTAIFATPSGELHEIGLLVAAVCAQQIGARAIYAGTQLPAEEIARICSALDARLVCLSTSCLPRTALQRELAEIAHALPPGIELWLGGRAAAETRDVAAPALRVYEDIYDFEDAIRRFCVRAPR